MPGVFKLPEETTRSIVEALRIRLTASERERLRPQEPASIAAYELYLKGLFFLHRPGAADLETSIRRMERAVAIDPGYAAAYSGMSTAYFIWATIGDQPAPALLASARRAASRSLEVGDVAEGHGAMGAVLAVCDWDWVGAEREFRRTLELNPSLVLARLSYVAGCLCPQRRYDEALDHVRRSLAIDPVSAFVRTISGQTLILAGRPAEAVDELHQALELEAGAVFSRYTLALAHTGSQSCGDAIAALEPIQHLAVQSRTVPATSGTHRHASATAPRPSGFCTRCSAAFKASGRRGSTSPPFTMAWVKRRNRCTARLPEPVLRRPLHSRRSALRQPAFPSPVRSLAGQLAASERLTS